MLVRGVGWSPVVLPNLAVAFKLVMQVRFRRRSRAMSQGIGMQRSGAGEEERTDVGDITLRG